MGGNILSNAIAQTKPKGIVAICGNASGNKLNTSVIPFILRAVKLWGVDSVNISKKRKEFVWGDDPFETIRRLVRRTLRVLSKRCQKSYHRDNWLVAAKRS